jgi:multisubunit Na+/H+ antiporter MnhF subunit
MSQMLNGVLLILALAMGLCFIRLLRGPSLADRVVALDQIAVHTVALAAVYSISVEQVVFLDVAVVAALLSFLGTIAFARYLEQGKDV